MKAKKDTKKLREFNSNRFLGKEGKLKKKKFFKQRENNPGGD